LILKVNKAKKEGIVNFFGKLREQNPMGLYAG
jgi:hypothetical protein